MLTPRPSLRSTYRFYTGTPVFKFGEGLSFSTFSNEVRAPASVRSATFSDALDLSSLSKRTATQISVHTVNTGARSSDHVVLLFASPPQAGLNGRPLKTLIGFERVALGLGEAKLTRFDITAQHLTVTTPLRGERVVAKGQWKVWVGADGESEAVTMTVV